MPADKTMESLPEPDDDAIKLVTVDQQCSRVGMAGLVSRANNHRK
jgi:hypothetical protein